MGTSVLMVTIRSAISASHADGVEPSHCTRSYSAGVAERASAASASNRRWSGRVRPEIVSTWTSLNPRPSRNDAAGESGSIAPSPSAAERVLVPVGTAGS